MATQHQGLSLHFRGVAQLVARTAGGREVASSSLVIPTILFVAKRSCLCYKLANIMKQKISTRAIIKQNDKVLLVRRAEGRDTLRGLYELPGGEIEFGEAPELAIRRKVFEILGVEPEVVQLHDVISELDAENARVQHVAIIYSVSIAQTGIELGAEHDRYVWQTMSGIQLGSITSMTALVLGITQFGGTIEVKSHTGGNIDDKNATTQKAILYSDGGSRGNPGPSAAGFIIMNERDEVVYEGGKYLGVTSNNQAEYQAVQLALEKALELGIREIEFRLDSLLVVNQMNGLYKVKNPDLWPIHSAIANLVRKFDRVHFVHVRREFNRLADGMVNKTLDAEMNQ